MTVEEIKAGLDGVGYIADDQIAWALGGTINQRIPLIVEGAPGVGKTFLAKALADMMKIPLLRVQFYEGLTYDKILYDYDYQRQLLSIQAISGTLKSQLENKTIDDALDVASKINFYGRDFLIERPVLKAINSDTPCVLLLDEVDKSSEEIEYTLLEVLDEFSMSIPQLGVIRAKEEYRPMVILTSNNYRDLSEALKRRCNYLYIDRKSVEDIRKILVMQAGADAEVAFGMAKFIDRIQSLPLKQTPSIAEAVTWAKFCMENPNVFDNHLDQTIYMLAKNRQDRDVIKQEIQGKAG